MITFENHHPKKTQSDFFGTNWTHPQSTPHHLFVSGVAWLSLWPRQFILMWRQITEWRRSLVWYLSLTGTSDIHRTTKFYVVTKWKNFCLFYWVMETIVCLVHGLNSLAWAIFSSIKSSSRIMHPVILYIWSSKGPFREFAINWAILNNCLLMRTFLSDSHIFRK